MRRSHVPRALALTVAAVAALTLAACSEGPTVPAPPSAPSFATGLPESMVIPERARASGYAEIHGTAGHERFTFNAVSTGTGVLAKGHVEVRLLTIAGVEMHVQADVTCVSVVGNEAWIGGQVTLFVFGGTELPATDRRMLFRVQDGGEGGGSQDFSTVIFWGIRPPGGDLVHCSTHPNTFPGGASMVLFPSLRGNIDVVQR